MNLSPRVFPAVVPRNVHSRNVFTVKGDDRQRMLMATAYDAFGFPLDQDYVPSSQPAPLRVQHMQRWARYWRYQTRGGMMPETLRRTTRLKILVWGGVPIAFRGTIWALLLDVPARRREAPPDYYHSLANTPTPAAAAEAEAEAASADAAVQQQIAKDTDRTWPRHRWLNTAVLVRVLVAWSRHNPE
eukprot:1820646-Prymnesium_polylepis.1